MKTVIAVPCIMFRVECKLFLIVLVWSYFLPGIAVGVEPAPPVLSPAVRGAMAWLPPDSDTLHVAQSFTIPSFEPTTQVGPVRDFRYAAQLSVLEGLFEPQHAKYLKPLAGKKVSVAIRGERGTHVVSHFGSLRAEGCSIICFEEDLGTAAQEWVDGVRKDARHIRKYHGHEVFVFGSTIVMEGHVQPRPWQGTFMVLLTSKCLLCASSDKYLEYVLDHLETPSAVCPFPASLPEWQHVDTAAPGWMLRHVPQSATQSLVGVTMTATPDRCRIVYLPLKKENRDPRQFVLDRWLGEDPIVEFAAPYNFEQKEDGTICVSAGLEAFDLENSLLVTRLGSLSGER